jgi:hypothetical protein
MAMDPFDEFQFKPLTEGLGFHKKPASLKDQVKTSGLVDDHLAALPSLPATETTTRKNMTFGDVISSLEKAPIKSAMADKSFLEVTEALPRTKPSEPKMKAMDIETPRPIQSPFPSSDIFRQPAKQPAGNPTQKNPTTSLNQPLQKSQAPAKQSTGTQRGATNDPRGKLTATAASVPAAFLDLFVVTAFSLIFLAALLSVTKVDLNVIVRAAQGEILTRISLGLVFLAIVQMYVVVSRAFYGRTLGEWTFDVQLGKSEDQDQTMYPMRVILRSLLTTITGFVLLPFLSLVIGKDLAGTWSGVQLYQQN